jgi:NADPH:quinone reductase-like Zn-dependent oxidoreductase
VRTLTAGKVEVNALPAGPKGRGKTVSAMVSAETPAVSSSEEGVGRMCAARADVLFDPVGGHAFDQALRAVNWEARMLVIGFAAGRIQTVPANLILVKNISVISVVWGAQAERDPALISPDLAELLRWWEAGSNLWSRRFFRWPRPAKR